MWHKNRDNLLEKQLYFDDEFEVIDVVSETFRSDDVLEAETEPIAEDIIINEETSSNEECEQNISDNIEIFDDINWDKCPLDISGSISGSSNSELIALNVYNNSSLDIDSGKLLIAFEHTNYDNSKQYITRFHGFETIWSGTSTKIVISGDYYNFLTAQIFPVCIYYKDGTVWGNSSASYDEIVMNSRPFYIEHYALNYTIEADADNSEYVDTENSGWDSAQPNDGFGMLPDTPHIDESWFYNEFEQYDVERDLDGLVDEGIW